MQKSVIVPVAEGFEEIELVSIVDILRRCGIKVTLSALDSRLEVRGAHEITIKAQCTIDVIKPKEFDAIALAGGYKGMQNMCKSQELRSLAHALRAQGALIAAICAAPIALKSFGLLQGAFTCYPSCKDEVAQTKPARESMQDSSAHFVDSHIVLDSHILTAQGPANAMPFALSLAELLYTSHVQSFQRESTFYQNAQNFVSQIVKEVALDLLYAK
ncbi:DJ-1 family protein [Helicobacter sp. MIT 00-7814]|uniref:DJ-1 family glyoxalase III n=1 Tax=unclassified Helicobacter TaxID=2593540 RepID=UPI000E1EC0A2|nr:MULTISPECIES: DJ-1 family glyoxalase III [unclassified Helicobacter]RDU53572.1 DJ-1 family protein [Helicobacter sp. MIT 00-7814]RDU57002.1 DJ-1 family protein [Helicobacter sp. MIT 99-10781]